MSVFETLNKIDVSSRTEKKGDLTYLSWSWAWGELCKAYPDATFTIYHNKDGLNYFTDGKTAWVEVGVTVEGKEVIEHLYVMDYRNNPVTMEKLTSKDVNTALKRCLTKAIALHGLGLFVYQGEDTPTMDAKEIAKNKTEVLKLAKQKGKQHIYKTDGVVNTGGVKPYHQLSVDEWELILTTLRELPDA